MLSTTPLDISLSIIGVPSDIVFILDTLTTNTIALTTNVLVIPINPILKLGTLFLSLLSPVPLSPTSIPTFPPSPKGPLVFLSPYPPSRYLTLYLSYRRTITFNISLLINLRNNPTTTSILI
jgi:hypothetical protein